MRHDDNDEIRLDIPLDAPPWEVNREPKMTHPTMSQDELIAQMRKEIDIDLLEDCLSRTPSERLQMHDAIARDIQVLRGAAVIRRSAE